MSTKVYLVKSASGSYEGFSEHLEKAFFDKAKAEECMNNYNKKLKVEKEQLSKCHECLNNVPFEEGNVDEYLNRMKNECDKFDVKYIVYDKDFDAYECSNSMDDYFIDEEHDASIEEIEVE